MSYVSNRKLTNVVGRIDYISNPKRQESIIDYYSTVGKDFWIKLGKENRDRFLETSNRQRKNIQPQEAREFIIAIPQTTDTENLLQEICADFKRDYGVECCAAIHYKSAADNLHIHLIYADRQLLKEPITVEEKVAQRTYYYNATGHKCKKAEAVKVVKKGTVLRKGDIRYFGEKINFYNMGFVKDFKKKMEDRFHLIPFDPTRHFATKHVGKNNPKGEHILEYNRLIKKINAYFDALEPMIDSSKGTPLEVFCKKYNVFPFSAYQNDLLSDLFEQFKKEYPLEKTETIEEDLLKEYVSTVTYAVDLSDDLHATLETYHCPYDIIKINAEWEKNGFPIDWYHQELAVSKFNRLIEKHSIDHELIKPEGSPSATLKTVDRVVDLFNNLLDRLKEKIHQLKDKLMERNISHPDPEQISKELHKQSRTRKDPQELS